jgi:hypothetical protein
MLFKTSIGHAGWRIYRISPTLLIIEDCVQVMITKLRERALTKERRGLVPLFTRFKAWTHGVLLRRLGRRRVVWLSKTNEYGPKEDYWKGNINLVTGLKESWLHSRKRFQRLEDLDDARISYEMVH